MKKFFKLKQKVEAVLRDHPASRDSDITLTIEIWKRYYPSYLIQGASGTLAVRLNDLYNLPREDNVKRIRAHYQNDQLKYLPTTLAVAKQRKINEEVWRKIMSQPEVHSRLRVIEA
jgi:hypothetical protein